MLTPGKSQLEYRRGQRNVTKNMDSFESKAVKGASRTSMDSPIMVGVPPNQEDSVTLAQVRPTSGMSLCLNTYTHKANGEEPNKKNHLTSSADWSYVYR